MENEIEVVNEIDMKPRCPHCLHQVSVENIYSSREVRHCDERGLWRLLCFKCNNCGEYFGVKKYLKEE